VTAQAPPRNLKAGGRKIWRAVVGEYELEEHETALLHELCRTRDNLDALAAVVAVEGVLEADTGRAHPALVESRQQRIAFARLAAALRLPAGDEEGDDKRQDTRRPQRRVGVRGIYGIDGGRSA
jgi:hypothetical protein